MPSITDRVLPRSHSDRGCPQTFVVDIAKGVGPLRTFNLLSSFNLLWALPRVSHPSLDFAARNRSLAVAIDALINRRQIVDGDPTTI